MRYTLSLLLCALAVTTVSCQDNSTNYTAIARGMIEGIVSTQGWFDMTSCMTNYDALTSNLADAINYYYQVDTSNTIAALKFGKALKIVPLAARTCNNSVLITQNVVNKLTSFASWLDYVRILSNNVATYNIDFVKEIYQANQAYNQTRMRDFGVKVGQAFAQVFLNGTGKVQPQPDANTTSVYMRVAQGFVEGFSTGLRWDQVKPCMKDTLDVQNDLYSAFQQLLTADPQIFAQGIASLGSALVDVPTAIQDCTGAKDKAVGLYNALVAIQDFNTYTNIVKNNAVVNVIDLYDAVATSTVDLNVGAYKDFGTNFGVAVAKLFFDNIQTARK